MIISESKRDLCPSSCCRSRLTDGPEAERSSAAGVSGSRDPQAEVPPALFLIHTWKERGEKRVCVLSCLSIPWLPRMSEFTSKTGLKRGGFQIDVRKSRLQLHGLFRASANNGLGLEGDHMKEIPQSNLDLFCFILPQCESCR